MKLLLLYVCLGLSCGSYAELSCAERVTDLLFSLTADDVSDEDEFVPTAVTNDYSVFLSDNGMTGDQLIATVSDIVRGTAVDPSTTTNRCKAQVLSSGLYFLDCYGGRNACSTFEFVITNCVLGGAVDLASYYYCKADIESNCASAIFYAPDYWQMQRVQREGSVLGMFMAFGSVRSSPVVTNRVLGVGMKALPRGESFGQFDDRVSEWWPAYATSSNRYIAAQLARQAVPPCASSNYLNRVIAELEALPPGTMQMLSTNHLGQAWGE